MLPAVFAALLCIDPGLSMSHSLGTDHTSFTVGATVQPRTGIVAQSVPSILEVLPSDVERGFVEVPTTIRLAVSNTNPDGFVLDLWPMTTVITTIIVRGAGAEASLEANGGTIVQRGQRGTAIPLLLTFRFNLTPGTAPGRYPWPVHFDARPLIGA